MDPASGMVGRKMTGMTNTLRSRDFTTGVSFNGGDNERASHTTSLGWGGNIGSIWNQSSAFGPGFASAARESSRPRENSTHADPIEGKTGSGSLVASSEKDQWNSNRSRWENTTTSIPHVRSSGVSPTRRRSVAQLEPSQHFSDNSSSTFFPISRQSAVGQSLVAQSTKPLLDPTSTNFTSARRIDTHTANGFANFGFGQADASSRPDASAGSWPDAASVHSPTDDRRSIVHSEYFGPSSTTASRNGSLPPSRHGNEPIHFGQTTDVYQRYAQSGQRQNASFSFANGRGSQERSGSIQSDIMPKYSRFGFEHDPDAGTMSHRPSISINNRFGSNYSPAVNGSSLAGDTYVDDGSYTNTGSFTPNMNNYGSGQVWEVDNLFRPVNFDSHSRSAPNGTGVRQSPHYSSAQTPANYDHLYPSGKIEQTLANSNNLAVVQHKLQGYQIQQERRNYLQPAQHYPYPFQFQQYMAANNERNYQLAYSMSNAMQIHIPPNMLSSVPGYLSIEPPKGPRNDAALSTMSQELSTFRNDIKNSRRIDLHQIYGHIVEFSGDQHGSRFIQGKLESANSDEKDKVFRELQEDCLQLMLDTFGNYVIQKFFEHGDQVQKRILATRMKGHIMTLSNNMYGCRVVQKALDHVLTDQQVSMVKELEVNVMRCVRDNNGNHVIQKVIDRVPLEYIGNIIDAFRGQVGPLATHGFGCRVVQRLLEKCPEPKRRFVFAELHVEGAKLVADQYGNYVTQHMLEYGNAEDRAKVIASVKGQLLTFSKHKFASNVVEKCMQYGTDDQARDIMLTTLEKINAQGENMIPTLIRDQFGNYVIQKLMNRLVRRDFDEFASHMKPEIEKAMQSPSGKYIESVEKRLYRFDYNRIDSPSDETSTPPLTSTTQSPQSSSLPSTNTSTIDESNVESVSASSATKDIPATPGVVSITPEHTS